jgi:hypothetical protein
LYGASKIKQQLMQFDEYSPIEEILLNYKEKLKQYQEMDD